MQTDPILRFISSPSPEAIADAILEYVRLKKKVLFNELVGFLQGRGLDVAGSSRLMASGHSNLLVWGDVSNTFVMAIADVLNKGLVRVVAVDKQAYLRKGFIDFPATAGYVGDTASLTWVPSMLMYRPV